MIKPEFFDDPDVAGLSLAARLCFIGLWTQADREGRLVDDVRRLKVRLFPYDAVDVAELLGELVATGMITRYLGPDSKSYLWIPKFCTHQRPHPKEPASVIPACERRAVEKHGEPCNASPSPSESGVLILDSGILSLEDGQPRSAAASPPSPVENVRVITKLAHHLIKTDPSATFADLKDDLKSACARHRIGYDADVAGKALESALAQRRTA